MRIKFLTIISTILIALLPTLANASLTENVETAATPEISNAPHLPNAEMSMRDLVSPEMHWTHLTFDALKAEGLDGSIYPATVQLVMKSDMMPVAAVAQLENPQQNMAINYQFYLTLLIVSAAGIMWLGLGTQRAY